MLLEFRVKNYRSFREEKVLSLVASSDTSLPDNLQQEGNFQIVKGAGLYGANASGKSNLIRALDTMQDMVLESMDYKPEHPLPIFPFQLDIHSREEPTEFEVSFTYEGNRYQYGFSTTRSRIKTEWLYVFPGGKGKRQTWFERGMRSEGREFGTYLKGEKNKIKELTRPNALFLSAGAKFNHEQLTQVFRWFQNNLRVVSRQTRFPQITEELIANSDDTSKQLQIPAHRIVNEMLRKADFGVCEVQVHPIPLEEIRFPKDMPSEIREKYLKNYKEDPIWQADLVHRNDKDGSRNMLPLREESDGTQQFFRLLGPFLESLHYGYTVFFDEIESSLHPLLTRELIRLFFNSTNTKGAQLIFATHDTTLMDPDLLRRDQVWFTEKNTDGATQLYSLAEFKGPKGKARKNEAMQNKYLAGKYGAIPILEAFSIDG
jgi:uncharacterized protein